MVQTIKFVYVVLLFISLLLVTNALKCDTDDDCPKSNTPSVPYTWRCYKNTCQFLKDGTLEAVVPK
ncbi:unnamed protein product [Trifolium pratense]|uniref:Uncharacterized protein n=1 Tax=Trifolium pratense TaxID=57577 RepID=A0ACB0JUD0_TRIPR|nr:unnamed protein product [Trifolium pratense]